MYEVDVCASRSVSPIQVTLKQRCRTGSGNVQSGQQRCPIWFYPFWRFGSPKRIVYELFGVGLKSLKSFERCGRMTGKLQSCVYAKERSIGPKITRFILPAPECESSTSLRIRIREIISTWSRVLEEETFCTTSPQHCTSQRLQRQASMNSLPPASHPLHVHTEASELGISYLYLIHEWDAQVVLCDLVISTLHAWEAVFYLNLWMIEHVLLFSCNGLTRRVGGTFRLRLFLYLSRLLCESYN